MTTTLDSRNLKVSVKDMCYLLTLVCIGVSNYFVVTGTIKTNQLTQDKVNAISDLRIQQLQLEIDELRQIQQRSYNNKPIDEKSTVSIIRRDAYMLVRNVAPERAKKQH